MRTWVVALAVALVAGLAAAAPAAAKPSYVALGDSFTSGPLIPLQIPPLGCLKSDHNYPHLLAPDLRPPEFRDISCGGAQTKHMTESQSVDPPPDNPPQFSALDEDTRIVTVGIGGNDIGFSEIARECTSTDPRQTPCQEKYNKNGNDVISQRIQRTAPKIAAVLQGIHERSPDARVYLVDYLPILPEAGGGPVPGVEGCWPQVPVSPGDVPYLREKHKELNAMLETQANATTFTKIVNAYEHGIGRDACQAPTVRWVEPAAPAAPAAPLHPNADGMVGTAEIVRTTIRGK